MEFKLPFPTLQELAVLKIAHSFMDLDMTRRTYAKLLCESQCKVDKLEILNGLKCRIRDAIRLTHDHLTNFYCSCRVPLDSNPKLRRTKYNFNPKLQFDVHGRVDEVRMANDFLQKGYSYDRWDTDWLALQHLLYVASYYVLLPDIQKILRKILKLCAKESVIPQLKGPEFQIDTHEKLCLVYKFVDQQGIPVSLNLDYSDQINDISAVRVSNTCVRITLNSFLYTTELFQLHWNFVEPARRIRFARNLIGSMLCKGLVRNAVNILHFLDPDSRHCIVGSGGYAVESYIFICRFFLVWPYQMFLIPALQLVRSLKFYGLMDLFKILVDKQDMMAFQEILCPLWEAISSEFQSRYFNVSLDKRFKTWLRELSRKNVPMYKRVATDLNLPFTYLRELRKRKYESLRFHSGTCLL